MARRLYVTRQAVSRWETGETAPGIDMVKLICVTFGVPLERFFDMPMFIIGPEDDSYDFHLAYMPLSSEYAALFTTDSSLEPFYRLDLPHVELMNCLHLLNCEHWDVALSRENGPLEHAIRDWAKTASN